jgi:hypothetical protein
VRRIGEDIAKAQRRWLAERNVCCKFCKLRLKRAWKAQDGRVIDGSDAIAHHMIICRRRPKLEREDGQ